MSLEAHSNGVRLADRTEVRRVQSSRATARAVRSELGQFLTPASVASFMASLFGPMPAHVRLIDPGAGVGSLTAAFVDEACSRAQRPRRIDLTAYELDEAIVPALNATLDDCIGECAGAGVKLSHEVRNTDFIASSVDSLDAGLFRRGTTATYTHAILNPPYKKLNSDSPARLALRRVGIETSNLYTAFLGLVIQLLEPGGELVAITPRSFCNGPYFRPFRELLLSEMAVQRLHVFNSRTEAFADDEVLQETVIMHAVKRGTSKSVTLSSSDGPDDDWIAIHDAPLSAIVKPDDPDRFIHLVLGDSGKATAEFFAQLPATLPELGLTVSTGKVVDFRAKEFLRAEPDSGTLPLIYPGHMKDGQVSWPKSGKKPNALVDAPETAELWMPKGTYALVKRFSAKEEPRRVVAAVFDESSAVGERIGFENHLNVYHSAGKGIAPDLARGLSAFLNSTLVDEFFRQFNGHTQVNATDLRNLRYPDRATLVRLGREAAVIGHDQAAIDRLVEYTLSPGEKGSPVKGKRKIDKAHEILVAVGMPRQQQNDRSALTLLALLGVKPSTPWSEATAPLLGITPIMEFIAAHYGKTYAPNTRETVRRQTIHQFVDAGLVVANPDDPTRAVNSAKNVYQIEAKALDLIRTFGTDMWTTHLANYLAERETLAHKYAQARAMARIPVTLPDGQALTLSPGGQNELIRLILEEFCSRFAAGGNVIYVGDTDEKWAIFDEPALRALGVSVDAHGKMPDVVVHRKDKNWLLLIEAVTSHGPVGPKRRADLAKLFRGSTAGLVFVTAFVDRRSMVKYLGDISWESEVWIAEAPDHMIHFNGEKFLGPYSEASACK